jgi:hypothetical protein
MYVTDKFYEKIKENYIFFDIHTRFLVFKTVRLLNKKTIYGYEL